MNWKITIAASVALGVCLSFAPERIQQVLRSVPPGALLVFAAVFPLCVTVHELGHAAAGLAAGFGFGHIAAGPFTLTRDANSYRFRFVPSRWYAGGQAGMIPRGPGRLVGRSACLALGGPAATALLFAPVAFLPWNSITLGFVCANSLVAALSWIPLVVRGEPADARMILTLAGRGPAAERAAAVTCLLALNASGVRPRDWPPQAADKLRAAPGHPVYDATAAICLHQHALDCGRHGEAAAALERVLAHSSRMLPDARRAYYAEAAFHNALNGRVELAQAWLADARKVTGAPARQDWDAEALGAIALAEGKREEAWLFFARARALVDASTPDTGFVVAWRERLSGLLPWALQGCYVAGRVPARAAAQARARPAPRRVLPLAERRLTISAPHFVANAARRPRPRAGGAVLNVALDPGEPRFESRVVPARQVAPLTMLAALTLRMRRK